LVPVFSGESGDYPADEGSAARVFAKPLERTLPLAEAVTMVAASECACADTGVPYLSYQNDSLRMQTPSLLADVRPLAFSPFVAQPEAVNLWVGTSRSTSSIHKDHYENLYAVVRGEKLFTLLPPCDVLWLYERDFSTGRYDLDEDGGWGIVMEEGVSSYTPRGDVPLTEPSIAVTDTASLPSTGCVASCFRACERLRGILRANGSWQWLRRQSATAAGSSAPACAAVTPWVSVNPAAPRSALAARFPLYAAHARPVQARVRAGEVLYLPALWYHQVAQPGPGITVAVNQWHDMDYCAPAFSYYKMCQSLAPAAQEEGDPLETAAIS